VCLAGGQAKLTLIFRRAASCRRARFAPLANGPARGCRRFYGLQNWPAVFGTRQCEFIFAAGPQIAIGTAIGVAGGSDGAWIAKLPLRASKSSIWGLQFKGVDLFRHYFLPHSLQLAAYIPRRVIFRWPTPSW
jgi:hypothetical protein